MVEDDRPAGPGRGADVAVGSSPPPGGMAGRLAGLLPLATLLLKVFLATALVTGLFGVVPGDEAAIS